MRHLAKIKTLFVNVLRIYITNRSLGVLKLLKHMRNSCTVIRSVGSHILITANRVCRSHRRISNGSLKSLVFKIDPVSHDLSHMGVLLSHIPVCDIAVSIGFFVSEHIAVNVKLSCRIKSLFVIGKLLVRAVSQISRDNFRLCRLGVHMSHTRFGNIGSYKSVARNQLRRHRSHSHNRGRDLLSERIGILCKPDARR